MLVVYQKVKCLPADMRNVPLRKQLLVFFLILSVSFILFTLVPSLFPHPEDFSPYAYIVAFIACLEVWLLMEDGKRKCLLLPILLVCVLALLDETGYGSEVMDIPPIYYSQTLHTQIRDLHNLIGIAIELGSQALVGAQWNGPLFGVFLAVDGLLLAAGLFFGWLLRFRVPRTEEGLRRRILWLTAGFWFASGLAAAIYLLSLTQDPTNAFFLGYSAIRLASVLGIFAISTALGILLFSQRKSPRLRNISGWLTKHSRIVLIFCEFLILVCLAYQLYAPFVFLPDQQTRLERITPLGLWLQAIAWFALLGAHAWRGGLREPVSRLFSRFADFLRREPAYLYMGCAVGLIVIAQLIDQGLIPLNTMIRTPGFHVSLWGLWTEETFEMNGAFMFIAAAFYFPKTK